MKVVLYRSASHAATRAKKAKAWRKPPQQQLDIEKAMQGVLASLMRSMVTSGKLVQPSKNAKQHAQTEIQRLLTEAHDVGVQIGQEKVAQRGIVQGIKNVVQRAADIVQSVLDRVSEWWSNHSDDDDIEQAFDDFVESMADGTAQYEVVAEVEDTVLSMMTDSGELEKSWLCEDTACDACQENASASPIGIDETFPSGDMAPPGHGRCRCVIG